MTSNRSMRARLAAALLSGAMFAATPASAQYEPDPGTALSGYLTRLASNPNDSTALIGAGEAALAMGDPQGAVSFFARAEELRPRDGRVKAGLGSALVHMGQPQAALRFFDEAQTYGHPAADMAKDRGLAYDLTGDPRRAQREYRIGLQSEPDDETSRNLALSLAISGDRIGALQAIDAQVRRQDRAAWRTRAFVLALTGDAIGATQAAAGVMQPAQAEAMRPFFARLPRLSPGQRAMAVHFGEMPAEGSGAQLAGNSVSVPLAADDVGVLDSGQSAARQREAEPVSSPLLRRRPIATGTERPRTNRPTRVAAASPQPERPAASTPMPTPAPPPAPVPAQPQSAPGIVATDLPPSASADPPAAPPAPARDASFASIASLIVALPDDEPGAPLDETRPARPAAGPPASASEDLSRVPRIERAPGKEPVIILPPSQVKAPLIETAEAKPAAKQPEKKPPAKKAEPPKPKEPSRYWVQIAGGANKSALPTEFKRLQGKAPKLLGSRTPWTTPLRATNRLLVGPFKTEAEARGFVNDLAERDLTAFTWTSPEGQKIEKLASK